MAKKYFIVHFSGHGDPAKIGQRDNVAFNRFSPVMDLKKDVSRFCFWSGLSPKQHSDIADKARLEIISYNGGDISNIIFLIHGYSAGGVTALFFAKLIPEKQIACIVLSDAAFQKGETDNLRLNPGCHAYISNDNYYQTFDNSPSSTEVHDRINGFTNIPLIRLQTSWIGDNEYHKQACNYGFDQAIIRMKYIVIYDK